MLTVHHFHPLAKNIFQGMAFAWLFLGWALSVTFDVHENIKLRRLGTFALNPKAEAILFTQSEYVQGTDSSHSTLYYISGPGKEPIQVCPLNVHASNVLYSSANNLYYFTDISSALDSAVNALYSFDPDTQLCTLLSNLPVDIDAIKVSPDGSLLAFSADVYIYNHTNRPLTNAKLEQERLAALPYKAKVFTEGYMRHWDEEAWPGLYRHLFVAPLPMTGLVTEDTVVDIMPGFDGDAPLKPFGGTESFAFSHDGSRLAFTTQIGGHKQWMTNDSIYYVDIIRHASAAHRPVRISSTAPTCLTCTNDGRDANPVFSSTDPDLLYYLSMNEPTSESDMLRLRRVSVSSQEISDLSPSFDGSFDAFTLARDEDVVFVLAHIKARAVILQCRISLGITMDTCTTVFTGGEVSQYEFTAGENRIYMSLNSFQFPADIFSLPLSFVDRSTLTISEAERVTAINADIMEHWDKLYRPEEFYLKSEIDGALVHSFFFRPHNNFDTSRDKCPLILYVHGGPESPWDDSWSYRWNPQILVEQGYCVLATNFHGSGSFGEEFQKSIRQHWFDIPVDDTMSAWKYVHETYSYVDKEKTCAMGASYGGTHVNWLMGHTDNITCFIVHDGIFDLTSFGLDTDELFFVIREMGGPVWEQFEMYERWNPARSAKNFSKPALVIHGGKDFRIHEYHGIALFQSLQLRGVPSRFIYFPTQSHWVWQPQESVVWHTEVVAWLDKYLKE